MSPLVKSYKELIFWQKARQSGLLIVELIRKLPSEKVSMIIGDQVIRSGLSRGACIAEGFGRYKGKEYPRFLQMSLGSAQETEYWIELIKDIYPQFSIEANKILELNEEVIKMITATLNKLKLNNERSRENSIIENSSLDSKFLTP